MQRFRLFVFLAAAMAAMQLFLGTYSLSGYSTYILVGRDGKIAMMQVPRSSELTQAVQEIERLL